MNSNAQLSTRAERALAILENGGRFKKSLETDRFTGRSQFKTRLLNASGKIEKGYGLATKEELGSRLVLLGGGTTVSDYWGLPYVHDRAQPNPDF